MNRERGREREGGEEGEGKEEMGRYSDRRSRGRGWGRKTGTKQSDECLPSLSNTL